jgi:hypothetical protein
MAMIKFRAPALPLPGQNYDQIQFYQLIRALQLYFNQLDSLTPIEVDSITAANFFGGEFFGEGRGLYFPYMCLEDDADQILTAALTPQQVRFNANVSYNDIFFTGNNGLHAIYAGVYNIQYSLQLVNTANTQHYAWVWIRKNGVDLKGSATKFSVISRKNPSSFGYSCAVSNVIVELEAGDYVEVWWAADAIYVPATSDGIYMEYYSADSDGFTHPTLPSALVTMTFVSEMPPSTVLGVSALGKVGSVTVQAAASNTVTGVSATGSVGSVTVSV